MPRRMRGLLTPVSVSVIGFVGGIPPCGAAYFAPGGAFEHTYPLVETKKALVSIAKKTVLLIDHTKCEHTSLCNSIPLSQIDVIITDDQTSPEIIKKAAGLGKEVLVVNPQTCEIVHHYNRS